LTQLRSFSAVLFRRIATRSRKEDNSDSTQDLFFSLPPPQKEAIRARLLEGLLNEVDNSTRNKVGDAVAEVARQYVAEGNDPARRMRNKD